MATNITVKLTAQNFDDIRAVLSRDRKRIMSDIEDAEAAGDKLLLKDLNSQLWKVDGLTQLFS